VRAGRGTPGATAAREGATTLAPITSLVVSILRVPTDAPESDGTLSWDSTTVVLVELAAGSQIGLGWSYTAGGAAQVVSELLAPCVLGRDAGAVAEIELEMARAVRNVGRPGIGGSAIAAVDIALWDLRAALLGVPAADLIGRVRDAVAAYGSGGFCSYSARQLEEQLGGWAADGMTMVKMKVGRDRDGDQKRVQTARQSIGSEVELFVDANGAYSVPEALEWSARFAELGVSYFEEPVSSDDLDGLRRVRDGVPRGMEVAAGEYNWTSFDARRMLAAQAVDILQIDATRCSGVSGFLATAALAAATPIPVSAHTAPTVHATLSCCTPVARHVEYFHDHARIEHLIFDGALKPERGRLRPDPSRPGFGVDLKAADAQPFLVKVEACNA
jgi:L-alanine-DL-glutamate epimerase-like enolase superfamily enzyme